MNQIHMKRTILICLSLLLLLSACSSPAPSVTSAPTQTQQNQTSQPTEQAAPVDVETAKEIVFWSTKEDVFAESTAQFTQETGIVVTATYMGGYDDMVDKVMAGIAANDLPDVAQLGQRHGISQMYDSGWLLPIEDYVSAELINDIIPGFWKRFVYKEKKVILPFQNSMPVLYYNKDLLQQASIEPPKDFASLLSSAKTLTDATGQYGFSLNSDYPWYILALMFNSGTAPIVEGKANMSDPAIVAIFEQIRQLAITDQSMPANQHKTAQEDFTNGRLGMLMASCASYAKVQKLSDGKFEVGVVQFPQITTMDIPMGGNGLGIFKSTPEKIAASAQFVEFMLEKERVAQGTLTSGYIPVTQASMATETYTEYLSDPNRATIDDQMNYLGGVAVNPADSLIWNEIFDLVDAIEADPNVNISQRLAEIDEKINKYLSQYAG